MPGIELEQADDVLDPETAESGEPITGYGGQHTTGVTVADAAAAAARAAAVYFTDQEPIDGKITVVELTPLTCRWPTGNPRDLRTFRYCGEDAPCGPYCERHARLAYLSRAA